MLRFAAVALSVSLVLAGCVGNSTPLSFVTPPPPTTLQATGAITAVDTFALTTPLAFAAGNPVVPLLEIPHIPTDQGTLAFTAWGTKDATGAITELTQAQIQNIGATSGSVHVFFDTSGLPVFFRDDATGYGIAVSDESSTQVTITLCTPAGQADSNVTLTSVNGNSQVGTVTDGGSCVLGRNTASRNRQARAGASAGTAVYTTISSLSNLTKVINAASYAAGFAFALQAILKFKQHKDNPTQIPISTPISLVVIAALLLFLPSILDVSGATLFDASGLALIGTGAPSYFAEGTLPGVFPSPDPTP